MKGTKNKKIDASNTARFGFGMNIITSDNRIDRTKQTSQKSFIICHFREYSLNFEHFRNILIERKLLQPQKFRV